MSIPPTGRFVWYDLMTRDVAKAEKLGARIFVPPSDIPGVGRFSVLADPTGALFALYNGGGE